MFTFLNWKNKMISLNMDTWVFGENLFGDREYIIHNKYPRFIGRIEDNEEGGADVIDIEFFDKVKSDPLELAKLMRQAGDAVAEYWRLLDER